MTIAQLIKKLQKLPLDREVIISSDSEGNSYDILNMIANEELYCARSIEKYPEYDIEREIQLGDLCDFEPKEDYTKPKKCIVLYP